MKKLLALYRHKILCLCLFSLTPCYFISAQIIETIAGNGVSGYFGDGGQATAAEFYYPNAVGFDGLGNMYVADESNNVIREVNASGIITTVAGNEIYGTGFGGDGGPATLAELYSPEGVWGDKHGNIYIADLQNRRIRKVTTAGIISTYAGNGSYGNTGDGGPATDAEFGSPYRLAIDTSGNVYVADQGFNCIRKVDTADNISTVAGNGASGFSGDGGPATSAELKAPYGVSVDDSGNIFIADCLNDRIRKVRTDGVISTYAGNGTAGFSGDSGPATNAELYGPFGVGADAYGNVYIDDQSNSRIRVVNSSGIISTFAGNGIQSYSGDGGPATNAEFDDAWDVSVDALGNVYIADEVNERVREVPVVSTGISENKNEQQLIELYPNPNNGMFTVALSYPELVSVSQTTIEIFNVLGEKVYFATLQPQTPTGALSEINLTGQTSGIYFYRVINENGGTIRSGKFVIE